MIEMKSIARALSVTAITQVAFALYLLGNAALNIREVGRCLRESHRLEDRTRR